jgi:transcriptional regulator with XRE-family HTH domain
MKNGTHLRLDGRKLYRRRIEKGLSLRELSHRCADAGRRVSDAHLSRLENGIYDSPRAALWLTLAAVLDCTIDELAAEEVA